MYEDAGILFRLFISSKARVQSDFTRLLFSLLKWFIVSIRFMMSRFNYSETFLCSFTDSISVAELSEAQDTVDSPTPQRCKLDDRNKTPASNQKQVGDRGRSRRVDVVTSAKLVNL
jgi:hypothetical protein